LFDIIVLWQSAIGNLQRDNFLDVLLFVFARYTPNVRFSYFGMVDLGGLLTLGLGVCLLARDLERRMSWTCISWNQIRRVLK
jgi:hypothetical protein